MGLSLLLIIKRINFVVLVSLWLNMSVETRFKKIKQVPHEFTIIVTGYMREMQEILRKINHSSYYNIPDLVASYILCFFYNFPYFVKCGSLIQVSGEEQNIVSLNMDGRLQNKANIGSAYYGDWICSTKDKIVKFTIRVICDACNEFPKHIFGIASNDTTIEKPFVFGKSEYLYAIDYTGDKWRKSPGDGNDMSDYHQIFAYQSGDIFTLILNLPKATIEFEHNGQSLGVCYDKIARKEGLEYKIAVSMCQLGDSITVVKYQEL